MGLFNKINSASPTQSPSVGGNYSPTSALKPCISTHINLQFNSSTLFIFTSPCFYHSSKNINNHISHNPHYVLSPITRALARLKLHNPVSQVSPESCDTGEPIKGPGFPVPGEYADEHTDQQPDSSVLLLYWHSCRTCT